jgi:hypothetical protein
VGRDNQEITMSKFLILYRAPESAQAQLANATPEQIQAGAEAWQAWATKIHYALADLGAPVAHTAHVGPGAAASDGVCGFSVIEAGSADEVGTILEGHPHLQTPGGSIEVLEYIPIGDL